MLGVEYITVVPEVGCMRMALTYSTIVVITTKCLVNISIHYQTCQARSQESASLEMESNTALISRHAPVITKFREEIRNCKIIYIYIKLTHNYKLIEEHHQVQLKQQNMQKINSRKKK